MIVSDGADHKRRRRSVQAAFSRRRLNAWIPMVVEQTDAAVDRLAASLVDGPRQVDLCPLGRAIVLDVPPVGEAIPRPVGMVVNRPSGGVPMRIGLRA